MPEVAFVSLSGPMLIPIQNHLDGRGSFSKLFQANLHEFSMSKDISVSVSKNSFSGTVRGLHIQIHPFSESKLITCLSGAVFDVIVDLRDSSPTFRSWSRVELTSTNLQQLYVPEGFAHGYQTLEDDTELIYIISGKYSDAHSRRIHYQDLELAIKWPLNITEISVADKEAKSLNSLLEELK